MEVEMLARQIAIGFGIAIIFPLLVYYGISTIHPAPKTPGFATVLANATPEERKITADEQRQRQETYRDAAKDFARVLVIAGYSRDSHWRLPLIPSSWNRINLRWHLCHLVGILELLVVS